MSGGSWHNTSERDGGYPFIIDGDNWTYTIQFYENGANIFVNGQKG